ncbi:MAG: hypothetical protein EOO13_10400 [Chitinophagaceae bacterium]|nr:MAG: hypothetical protein EOO13_10400 [Chitinophagaceae bacterium]
MRKSFNQFLLAILITSSALYSCSGNSSSQFSTRQDSLSFAKAVLLKYPGQENSLSDTVPPVRSRNFQDSLGMKPISPETVKMYSDNYDKDPQLKAPEGYYYQGFTVDTAGYSMLTKIPSIKGLYLRLGKKEDGSYTIMILGLNGNGKRISAVEVNRTEADPPIPDFDQLRPCPENCPE